MPISASSLACISAVGSVLDVLPDGEAVAIGVVDDQESVLACARGDSELGTKLSCNRIRIAQVRIGHAFVVGAIKQKGFDCGVEIDA